MDTVFIFGSRELLNVRHALGASIPYHSCFLQQCLILKPLIYPPSPIQQAVYSQPRHGQGQTMHRHQSNLSSASCTILNSGFANPMTLQTSQSCILLYASWAEAAKPSLIVQIVTVWISRLRSKQHTNAWTVQFINKTVIVNYMSSINIHKSPKLINSLEKQLFKKC